MDNYRLSQNAKDNLRDFIKALRKQLKVEKHFSCSLPGGELHCVPTTTNVLNGNRSAFLSFDDKRRNSVVIWYYNPRQWTVSFAILLHELGHYDLNHVPQDPIHELQTELEAWEWAVEAWEYAKPVNRRFPYIWRNMLLDTHYRYSDPYIDHDERNWLDFEEEFYAEKETYRKSKSEEDNSG